MFNSWMGRLTSSISIPVRGGVNQARGNAGQQRNGLQEKFVVKRRGGLSGLPLPKMLPLERGVYMDWMQSSWRGTRVDWGLTNGGRSCRSGVSHHLFVREMCGIKRALYVSI
ncbi:hypothetical protein J1N35_017442 [Gossypium stocksii]|uniref:Uncharacterized protein n=1 Tax=Gossypium stocksii TaxID=47602 RepID=A0A9D3VP83_9ROSI|nr:hypothetical protein J1N35_017442 [Gossypium stocksii]